MIYALIQEGEVARFPYTTDDLRKDNPRTGFPASISDRQLRNYGVLRVVELEKPDTSNGQTAVPDALPTLADGSWVLGWTVRDKTAEEIAADRAQLSAERGSFAVASAMAGLITSQEAKDWAGGNSLPAAVTAAIQTLPAEQQLAAEVRALTAQTIHRMNPLVLLMQAAFSLDDTATDRLFEAAAAAFD